MRALRKLIPIISRARPLFGMSHDYRDVCSRTWEISPAIETVAPPAIFDHSDLQKITSTGWEGTTVADEIAHAKGGPVRHAATCAYELKDAALAGGHIFTYRAFIPIKNERPKMLLPRLQNHYSKAVLASTWVGSRFFGHWLIDDLPLVLAGEGLGTAVSLLTSPSNGQRQYLDSLALDVEFSNSAAFDKLVVIDDIGQNADKARRYRHLRHKISEKYPQSGGARVMLLRGTSGARRVLLNELEVAERLSRRGFIILDPMKTPVADILEQCVGASMVVGVEGSHLLNGAFWMREGGALVVIQPPNRFQLLIKVFCDCVGITYAFVVADQAGADFKVDVDALEHLIQKIDG